MQRVLGMASVLAGRLPLGEGTLVAVARWLSEVDTKKRLAADHFRFNPVCQF